MTLGELQDVLDGADVSVSHAGLSAVASRRSKTTNNKYSVTLAPNKGSRWQQIYWRGFGSTLEKALEAAIDKLAASAVGSRNPLDEAPSQ